MGRWLRHVVWVIVLVALWLGPSFESSFDPFWGTLGSRLGMQPAWGAIAQPDRTTLTLDGLQDRLKVLQSIEGGRVIDLSRLTIDLRPENGNFRDQFYTLVQAQLQRPGSPIGLDLSYSQIIGDWSAGSLGLRAPLYGQALSPIFSQTEQEQLRRDRRRLSRLSTLSQSLLSTPTTAGQSAPLQITVFRGPLKLIQTRFSGFADLSNTFFLGRVEAQSAQFLQGGDAFQTRFSQPTSFAGAFFGRETRFRNTIFFSKAEFNQAQFQEIANFQSSEFQGPANFSQTTFQKAANFARVQWQGNADFAQVHWQDQANFSRNTFNEALFLTDAIFDKIALFRESQFNRPVNLRGASILDRIDFGYTGFGRGAYLNVPGIKFDADRAKFVGDPGRISRYIQVPTVQGNENILRELVRNFRKLEQIPDANYMEYVRERLHLQELRQELFGVNINTASEVQLTQLGLGPNQIQAILTRRAEKPFRSVTELLSVDAVDLARYINLRDRIVTRDVVSPGREVVNRISTGFGWLGLSLLLLLTRYGTDFWLIFGVGLLAIAYFSVLFWLCDRARRLTPQPILPGLGETVWICTGFAALAFLGITSIFRTAEHPWLTLLCTATVVMPVPTALLLLLYEQGRYHDLMDISYFYEEGSLRQLRVLIGRLPIIPRFELFRERYLPIQWDRSWNWLNYFDFSLNNFLKFGFNDIRLRDEQVPGLVLALVWYQWTVGLLYVALLLWTLSRTIPGLNVLIYFR
jgi:uncharacterized protein YjiS (DUF1127 family)